jgi:hypothetical protein
MPSAIGHIGIDAEIVPDGDGCARAENPRRLVNLEKVASGAVSDNERQDDPVAGSDGLFRP